MDTLILVFLTVTGLGLGVSSIAFVRDYGRHGLLALLSGAGILAAVFLWLQPLLAARGDDGEVKRLQAELVKATTRADEADRANAAVTARLDQATQAKSTAEQALDTSLSSVRQEIGELQQHYSDAGGAIYLDAAAVSYNDGEAKATPALRLEHIKTNLAALRQLKPRLSTGSIAPPPLPEKPDPAIRLEETRDLMRLKDTMSTRLETPHYDVEVYPQKELVDGRRGKYYVVDFKDAASGIRYYFEGGKYSIARGNAEFRSSLNTFIADVLKKIDGKVRYDLFVRGSADAKPYQGRFEPGLEYQEIPFLKNAGNDKYAGQPVAFQLGENVRNGDLPNLRAAFMRDVVAENYPVKPPVILEGAVSPKANDRDRNVELILFIDW